MFVTPDHFGETIEVGDGTLRTYDDKSCMADALLEQHPGKHLVFSGGVMSNGIIRKDFEARYDCSFAAPEFSADNAAGVAVLASQK